MKSKPFVNTPMDGEYSKAQNELLSWVRKWIGKMEEKDWDASIGVLLKVLANKIREKHKHT